MIIYTNFKKPKRKLTKTQQEEAEDYRKLKEKWKTIPKFSTAKTKKAKANFSPMDSNSTPSKSIKKANYTPGVLAKKETLVYTGTACLGVAVMHKSNPVPIFNSEAAVDVAKMRRN